METWEYVLYGGALSVLAVVLVKKYFGQKKQHAAQIPVAPKRKPLGEKRDFTVSELKKYDGSDPTSPVLMAVKGKVYDVTSGAKFYGPGGPYAAFAGKDASIALAKGVVEDVSGSLDSLTKDEMDSLNEWENHYQMKYEYVGKLIPDPDPQ